MIYLQKIKRIPGYPDYGCDEDGNVYSFKLNKLTQLKPCVRVHSYLGVGLSKNKKRKSWNVHQLVAMTFLKDFSLKGLEVDHIDRNPQNNKVSNLRMVTKRKNQENRIGKGYTWNKNAKKWVAKIVVNGVANHLGYFDKEEDARAAYIQAKKIYHNITNI